MTTRGAEWLAQVVATSPEDLEPTEFAEIGQDHVVEEAPMGDDCARISV